jgi:glucose/arabinose dehydrogenase
MPHHVIRLAMVGVALVLAASLPAIGDTGTLLTGMAAMQGWKAAAPGVRRLIRPDELPPPYATKSASNPAEIAPRPQGALPQVPPGFAVAAFAAGLKEPRLLRTAPNGDVFLAESGAGRIRVLRAPDGADRAAESHVFAQGLEGPFGIAFYPPGPDPQWVYVADSDKLLRFPYRSGDTEARGRPDTIAALPPGGHWTRDVLASADGRRIYVSVGSESNDAEGGMAREKRRADILEFNPDGSGERVFASGLRNPVALAIHPATGDLWTVVNERDGLGDNLPPDYATRVRDGGFYGWPWYYIGTHEDPRHRGQRPDLRDKVTTPDVLLEAHSAPLGIAVYTGTQFPAEYRGDLFVAAHGSWNRATRTGYKLVRVRLKDGRPTGEYEDFMTGFVSSDSAVWGRPVGIAVARDGALLMSDDASGTVWRIAYAGR